MSEADFTIEAYGIVTPPPEPDEEVDGEEPDDETGDD